MAAEQLGNPAKLLQLLILGTSIEFSHLNCQ